MKKTIKSSKTIKKVKTSSKKRQVATPNYKSFQLSRRITHPAPPLPGTIKLLRGSFGLVLQHKKLFLGITLLHVLLSLVLVRGLGFGSEVPELKSLLDDVFGSGKGQVIGGIAVFSFLLGATGSAGSEAGSVYQTVLFVIVSLAFIWALRQSKANYIVGIKESLYKGMYPLIPFVMVLLVIVLQLIPFAVGTMLYGTIQGSGLAVGIIENIFWLLVFGLFGLLSLYMLSSSLFALYIVTLPDVEPMQALRSARKLVQYRRWSVMRRVLLLPIAVIVIVALIMVPVIIFLTPVAELTFFALSMFSLVIGHAYLYSLYRELL